MVDKQETYLGANPAGVSAWGRFSESRFSAAAGVLSRPVLMLFYFLLSTFSVAAHSSVAKSRSELVSAPRSGRRRQRAVRLSSGRWWRPPTPRPSLSASLSSIDSALYTQDDCSPRARGIPGVGVSCVTILADKQEEAGKDVNVVQMVLQEAPQGKVQQSLLHGKEKTQKAYNNEGSVKEPNFDAAIQDVAAIGSLWHQMCQDDAEQAVLLAAAQVAEQEAKRKAAQLRKMAGAIVVITMVEQSQVTLRCAWLQWRVNLSQETAQPSQPHSHSNVVRSSETAPLLQSNSLVVGSQVLHTDAVKMDLWTSNRDLKRCKLRCKDIEKQNAEHTEQQRQAHEAQCREIEVVHSDQERKRQQSHQKSRQLLNKQYQELDVELKLMLKAKTKAENELKQMTTAKEEAEIELAKTQAELANAKSDLQKGAMQLRGLQQKVDSQNEFNEHCRSIALGLDSPPPMHRTSRKLSLQEIQRLHKSQSPISMAKQMKMLKAKGKTQRKGGDVKL